MKFTKLNRKVEMSRLVYFMGGEEGAESKESAPPQPTETGKEDQAMAPSEAGKEAKDRAAKLVSAGQERPEELATEDEKRQEAYSFIEKKFNTAVDIINFFSGVENKNAAKNKIPLEKAFIAAGGKPTDTQKMIQLRPSNLLDQGIQEDKKGDYKCMDDVKSIINTGNGSDMVEQTVDVRLNDERNWKKMVRYMDTVLANARNAKATFDREAKG